MSRYRFVVKVGDKEAEIGPARFSRWRDLHKYIGKKLAGGYRRSSALTYLWVGAEQGLPPLDIKSLSYNWFQRNEYVSSPHQSIAVCLPAHHMLQWPLTDLASLKQIIQQLLCLLLSSEGILAAACVNGFLSS